MKKIDKIDELIEVLLFLDENHLKITKVGRNNRNLIAQYNEELMQQLFRLDDIMIPHLRIFRKACVQQIQELQNTLDSLNHE